MDKKKKNTGDEGTITTLDDIRKAREVLYSSPDIVKTPLLCHVQNWFPSLPQSMDLYLKMENAQTTGIAKPRGYNSSFRARLNWA